jgi:hypothetical protein
VNIKVEGPLPSKTHLIPGKLYVLRQAGIMKKAGVVALASGGFADQTFRSGTALMYLGLSKDVAGNQQDLFLGPDGIIYEVGSFGHLPGLVNEWFSQEK